MGSLNILSSLMQFLWPALSIATFIVCLQIQGRHKGTKGVSLLVSGSSLVMFMSIANTIFRVMIMNGGMNHSSSFNYYSITGLVNLVGQVLFLIGLYQFGMARREDAYDDLLD